MFSSAWVETPTTPLFNEATVYNATDQVVANNVFMGMLEDLLTTVVTQFCIIIGADRRLALQFQSLPTSALVLSSKAAFKGRVISKFLLYQICYMQETVAF